MAFLTIITPTFNAGKFVEKCIESVQNQLFKDYEHVIVDGISSDDTVAKVGKYLEKNSRIKLIVEKDEGVFDAMNKGIKQNNSEWYYFLGADDSLHDENVLQIVVENLASGQSELIYGDVIFKSQKELYDGEFDIEKILKRNLCHQAIFYHRSVFEKIGLYRTKYKINADYDLNLRCWLSGKISHRYIPHPIAFYADGGLSSTNVDVKFENDYPDILIEAVLSGSNNWPIKIDYLSRIYRKLVQRYSVKTLMAKIFTSGFLIYHLPAVLWMGLSSPFFLVKKIVEHRK